LINLIAWLYWNPPKEAFTIPILERTVVWYGILFVTGFILGYFILNPILSRFLNQSKHISEIDILDWKALLAKINIARDPLSLKINQKLTLSTRKELSSLQEQKPNENLKQQILKTLNALLQEGIERTDLEKAFPTEIATTKQTSYFLSDRLCWFVVIGTIVGARLGHVFFYDWELYKDNPIEIFQIWKGGLASHGGVLGVMLSIYLYTLYIHQWVPSLTFVKQLDFLSIPSALASVFIRLGNFMNQEILGTPSNLPWAVVFGNPADGTMPLPRHPVQLYEAAVYLFTFVVLYQLWKKKGDFLPTGTLIGLMLILIFGSRFILEFWKDDLGSNLHISSLQMGQLLSIPFVLFGLFLMLKPYYKMTKDHTSSC
jgi:phosphatidylglycerol:prolipoprotein diacylglycerol transferase